MKTQSRLIIKLTDLDIHENSKDKNIESLSAYDFLHDEAISMHDLNTAWVVIYEGRKGVKIFKNKEARQAGTFKTPVL